MAKATNHVQDLETSSGSSIALLILRLFHQFTRPVKPLGHLILHIHSTAAPIS